MEKPYSPAIVHLRPTLQNYSWGRIGRDSLVATLAKNCFNRLHLQSQTVKDDVKAISKALDGTNGENPEDIGNFQISAELPYAELWMGMHPRGTSVVYSPQEPRIHHLQLDKFLTTTQAKIASMPFLFKVLSVAKPLSIQAHPDAIRAKELFETNPAVYSDPNPKPEMTIAVGYLELLCGFRQLPEISFFIQNIPELQCVLGETTMNSLGEAITRLSDEYVKDSSCSTSNSSILKALFTSLLKCSDLVIQRELNRLMDRLTFLKGKNAIPQMDFRVYEACKLAQRLNAHFPGDVGVFCAFFLNFYRLDNGCSIYISANKLHAYLAGNCIECMANSDNVVRGGLTPKFKDTELLLDILDFEPSGCTVEKVIPEVVSSDGIIERFHASTERDYFQIYKIQSLNSHSPISHCFSNLCHSIGIVLSSPEGVEISHDKQVFSPCVGDVLMFRPCSHFIIRRTLLQESSSPDQGEFLMYVATCGDKYSL